MRYFIRKKKKKGSILAMLFIILPLLMLSTLSSADPLYTFCSPDRNYTADGQFENNLKLLLDSLSSNISRNDSLSGFYNTTIGDNPYRVYGQALCRLDVSAEVCQSCIQNANQNILKSCSMSADAMIWYELCQVRYSFQMFFSLMVYTGKLPPQVYQEKNISKPDQFSKVMKYLMKNLTSETATNPSKNMFATGEIKFSKSMKIYGLSQCTRDMSTDNCYNCFQSALTELYSCCSSREGGIVVSRNCNLRFQLYRFYNDTSSSLLIYPSEGGGKRKTWEVLLVCGVALILAIFIGYLVVYIFWRKKRLRDDISENALLDELASPGTVTVTQDGTLVTSDEFPFMDLATIRVATNDFADSNKLGQGGFGVVYKGVLPDLKEVAVKRLSRKSWQGLEELRNEVILIAKLQHRNLVRLLGCAIEGDEKLLLYDFMPNRSLDTFIFDSERRSQLNWETYYNIIGGIARGLLYLHEDSRLKIIHRDLKPNNVLLDHEMVAKISDFGMARIFSENQNTNNTKRVVGTYGYMAPEYAMGGTFSIKSDVFSFGVILLEIISGKKNSGFYLTGQAQTLLAYAWRLWKEGKELEFVDPLLMECREREEVVRCIHIGLLCVQEDPSDRPNMSTVVALLGSESKSLPEPTKPAFAVGRVFVAHEHDHSTSNPTINGQTFSSVSPR